MVWASLPVWQETQPTLFASASLRFLHARRGGGADQAVVANDRLFLLRAPRR